MASAVTTVCALPPLPVGALAVQMRRDLSLGISSIGVPVAVFFVVAALLPYVPAGWWRQSERA